MKNALVLIAACAGFTAALAGNVQIQVLDKDGQPVPDAVVVLYPAASQAAAPTLLPPNPVVEQEKMRFVPAVSVVAAGTTVRFVNRDTWDHHVRGTAAGAASFQAAADGAGFELRLDGKVEGKPASNAEVRMDKPGPVLLGCHLHGSMRGHVFVTDSAWTLKTDADGIARFTAMPDGAAQLRVWHAEQLVDLPRKNLQVQPTPVLDTMQLSVVPRPRRPLPASAPAPARAGSAPHIHY